jgi:hypothetical protein
LLDVHEVRLAAGETLAIALRDGGHWYGHGFGHVQPYPLETGQIVNPAFAVNNIQCPAWMCSAGYVFFAQTMAPLAGRINDGGNGRLEISCPSEALCVRVFQGNSLRAAHQQWTQYVGWPNQPPPASLFGDSLFCSWTQYPRCITLFIRAERAESLSPLREALSHIRRGCIASGTTTTTWQAGLDRDLSVSG